MEGVKQGKIASRFLSLAFFLVSIWKSGLRIELSLYVGYLIAQAGYLRY